MFIQITYLVTGVIMSKKYTILKGTFILTTTGIITRLIGFFYRVYLSQTFGEEGVGLYQLIFPVYALCFSLTAAGIETTISRCVARKAALGKLQEAREFLFTGMSISFLLSCIVTIFLQNNAHMIAVHFIGETRCIPLLTAMSYAFPFAAIHSCICGYYLGLKRTGIPAASQLIEQIARVLSVYLFSLYLLHDQGTLSVTLAVSGLVAGEIFSSLFCAQMFFHTHHRHPVHTSIQTVHRCLSYVGELFRLSVPLTANRILLNLLQSIEAISIPKALITYGSNRNEALSLYGVLTGMALPCILFPSALTNSISVMLLPTVAELQASQKRETLLLLIKKVFFCCFALGLSCTIGFLLFGRFIGSTLFHSTLAGSLILTLAWICPFLYTNSTLVSILNGLGYTASSFFVNTVGLLLRIASVFFLIPLAGIRGYLWGLLGSQLTITLLCLWELFHLLHRNPSV